MIRSLILSATLLAALAAAGCGGGGSKNGGPTQPATVAALLSQFEAAYQAKDAAGVAAMCAYPFVMDGVSIGSADTLRGYLQATFDEAGDYQVAELLDRAVEEDGDSVTVTGTFHLVDATHGESSQAVTITGVRVDGVWKANSFTRD